MRRLLLILLIMTPLTGCQFLSAGEDVAIIDPFEGAEETIAEAGEDIAQALDGDAADETFADVAVEASPAVTAELISSTDPEARTRLVSQSRVDPFAGLAIPLAPEPIVIPAASNTSNNSRPANNGAGNSVTSNNNTGGGNGGSSNGSAPTTVAARMPTLPPIRVQPPNEPLVRPSPITPLPRIPQPVVAPTIAVSGVVQLGGEPYAIVSSSSEPERYVRVGDRLAGGSVRVKRIDTMAFEPQVILEENGIEVSRPIGSGGSAEPDAPAEAPAAAAQTVPVAAVPLPQVAIPTQAVFPPLSLPAPAATTLPAS
ncbi:MAG: hypothetical protein WA783_07345 [Phormidesmis sp.]